MIHMDSNLHFRWTFFTRLTGKTLLASSETRKLIQTCDSNHFSNKPQVKDLPGVSGLYKEKKKKQVYPAQQTEQLRECISPDLHTLNK